MTEGLDIRAVNLTEDYATLCEWWGASRVPLYAVPPIGLIVFKGGVDIAAGFLITSDAQLGWVDFLASNPQVEDDLREAGLDFLMDALLEIAERSKCRAVLAAVKDDALARFRAHGFEVSNTKMVVRVLGSKT